MSHISKTLYGYQKNALEHLKGIIQGEQQKEINTLRAEVKKQNYRANCYGAMFVAVSAIMIWGAYQLDNPGQPADITTNNQAAKIETPQDVSWQRYQKSTRIEAERLIWHNTTRDTHQTLL